MVVIRINHTSRKIHRSTIEFSSCVIPNIFSLCVFCMLIGTDCQSRSKFKKTIYRSGYVKSKLTLQKILNLSKNYSSSRYIFFTILLFFFKWSTEIEYFDTGRRCKQSSSATGTYHLISALESVQSTSLGTLFSKINNASNRKSGSVCKNPRKHCLRFLRAMLEC